jgi:hypothetical protein
MKRQTVIARIWDGPEPREIMVCGQTAKALHALVQAGAAGCTALDVAGWAYRFAAYCYELRREHGLHIRTDREQHPGGWHGRHVLETRVEIISIEGDPRCLAA